MRLLIVPDVLRNNINQALDRELAKHPEAAPDRQLFYDELLRFFDDNGYLPEFSLELKHDTNPTNPNPRSDYPAV